MSAAAGEGKDREFFEAHWPDGADAELVTRSMELGVLNVTGPAARRLLDRVTDADLSNEAFGWLRGRLITVVGVPDVRALRVGFTGELGWELHLRVEDLATVYDALWAAGTPLGVADAGNHALDSLRMEKRYLTSRELTHDVNPDEAGLQRFVKIDKGDFVGRDALLARRGRAASGEEPYRWRARLSGRGSRRRRRARGRRRLRRWPRRRSGDLRRLRLPLPAGPGFRLPGGPSTPSPAPHWMCVLWATCGPRGCSARPSMIRRTRVYVPRGRAGRA